MQISFDPSHRAGVVQEQGRRRPPGPNPMEGVADRLGLTADDLKAARDAGQSLAELATSKGISRDDLLAAVTADLQQHAPEGAEAPSAAQAAELAADIVDRKPGAGGPPPGAHGGRVDATSLQMPDESILDALRAALDGGDAEGLRSILDSLRSDTAGGYGSDGGDAASGGSLGLDARC